MLFFSARSEAYDPDLRWWTITTEHFIIHYHDGENDLAQRVAKDAEQALEKISRRLGHMPQGRIVIVVTDFTDSANGSSTVLPYNLVNVIAALPDDMSVLNDMDDHIRILITHELTHTVHMDTVAGLPHWINLVLGRTIYPNGAQPGWFTEGLAVQTESALSSAGRIRSSLFRMYLRTAALADRFSTLDEMGGVPRKWPQATTWYLYGGFFVQHISESFGYKSLSRLSAKMGSMLIPWSLNLVAKDVLGENYPQLFKQWRKKVYSQAQESLSKIRRAGITAFTPITSKGQIQWAPKVSPGSSQILYFSAPADGWPCLRLVGTDGKDDRCLLEVNSDGGACFLPDGNKIIYSQVEIEKQFYAYSDLFSLDLESGDTRRLTLGLRAHEPDVAPDGRHVVFVANQLAKNRLMILDLQTLKSTTILESDARHQYYTPKFSPDGSSVVFSRTRHDGGREIFLMDLQSQRLKQLTSGRFMDIQPSFLPGGKTVIFSSDRTGIYNLYSVEIRSGQMRRLTNVVTGAFQPCPSPDGHGIAFTIYGPDGFDIAWVALPLESKDPIDGREPRPAPVVEKKSGAYPVRPYNPLFSLSPRAWFPTYGQDPWGSTFGLMFAGQDALSQLSYMVNLTMNPEPFQVYFDASLWAQVLYPSISLFASRHIYRTSNQAMVNDRPWSVDTRELTFYGEMSFPFSSVRQYNSLFINYDLHLYDSTTRLPRDPLDQEPVLPDDRTMAWIGLGWYGTWAQRYIDSISTEKGLAASVSLRYSHPAIGSGFNMAELWLWSRAYIPVIPRLHHVVAIGLQGAVAIGDERRKSIFSLGGLPITDPVRDAYFGYRYTGVFLRGYEPGAFAGYAFMLASVEYRMPILDIHRGLWTLPVFLRYIHGAVFVDAGGASADPSIETMVSNFFKVGLGAEIRLDMLLAYYLPFGLRFGYARGLMSGGTNNFYLTLGTGF